MLLHQSCCNTGIIKIVKKREKETEKYRKKHKGELFFISTSLISLQKDQSFGEFINLLLMVQDGLKALLRFYLWLFGMTTETEIMHQMRYAFKLIIKKI